MADTFLLSFFEYPAVLAWLFSFLPVSTLTLQRRMPRGREQRKEPAAEEAYTDLVVGALLRSTLLEACWRNCPRHSSLSRRTMKLLTHNMLTSKAIKNVQEGYPLKLKVEQLELKESEFNKDFIVRLIPRIHYDALRSAAVDVGKADELPATLPEDASTSEDFLKKLHHFLIEVEVVNGELICPETGRSFPIRNGIPNMLLKPEEVS